MGWIFRVMSDNRNRAGGSSTSADGFVQHGLGDAEGTTGWLRDQGPRLRFFPDGFTKMSDQAELLTSVLHGFRDAH